MDPRRTALSQRAAGSTATGRADPCAAAGSAATGTADPCAATASAISSSDRSACTAAAASAERVGPGGPARRTVAASAGAAAEPARADRIAARTSRASPLRFVTSAAGAGDDTHSSDGATPEPPSGGVVPFKSPTMPTHPETSAIRREARDRERARAPLPGSHCLVCTGSGAKSGSAPHRASDRGAVLSCHARLVPRPRAPHASNGRAVRATVIALVILVLVDAHDAATPLPGALARAAEEALGADASVSIRTVATMWRRRRSSRRGPRGARDRRRQNHVDGRPARRSAPRRRVDRRWPRAQLHHRVRRVRPARGARTRDRPRARRAARAGESGAPRARKDCACRRRARRHRRERAAGTAGAGSATSRSMPRREAGFAVGGVGSGAGGTIGLRWQPGVAHRASDRRAGPLR